MHTVISHRDCDCLRFAVILKTELLEEETVWGMKLLGNRTFRSPHCVLFCLHKSVGGVIGHRHSLHHQLFVIVGISFSFPLSVL